MTDHSPSDAPTSHEPTYDDPIRSDTDQHFYCRVVCACGDFERTAKSKVSAAQARANARSTFARHVKAAQAAAEERAVEERAAEEVAADESPRPEVAQEQSDPDVALELALDFETPVDQEPEREPETVPEPAPEPEQEPTPPPQRRPALLMAAGFGVVLIALVVGLIAFGLTRGDGDAEADVPLPGTPTVAPTVTLPDVSTRAEYGRALRRSDPVFANTADAQLAFAGKKVCHDYAVGLNVVEITSAIIGRGVLDSHQAAILIATATPVFCPRFAEPIQRELSGLS